MWLAITGQERWQDLLRVAEVVGAVNSMWKEHINGGMPPTMAGEGIGGRLAEVAGAGNGDRPATVAGGSK